MKNATTPESVLPINTKDALMYISNKSISFLSIKIFLLASNNISENTENTAKKK